MSSRKNELVPVVPPDDHPYMHDLYVRTGLQLTSEADVVLSAAHRKWRQARGPDDRHEVAELLLGRRIGGWEVQETLPAALGLHINQPQDFEGLLIIASVIAKDERER